MTRRRRHFAAERLSKEGQQVVRRGYDNKWTLQHTLQALEQTTGEQLSDSALHRYWDELRVGERIERSERAAGAWLALVEADPDGRAAKALGLMVQERMLHLAKELDERNFDELVTQWKELERLQLAHKRTAIAERAVEVEDRKAGAAVTQAEAALRRVMILERQIVETREKLQKAAAGAKGGKVPLSALQEAVLGLYGIEVTEQQEATSG